LAEWGGTAVGITDAEAGSGADPRHASACGVFCPACVMYVASHSADPAYLVELAQARNLSVQDVRCEGCSSDTLYIKCRSCHFRTCAAARGLPSCGSCPELPCPELQAFQAERPHRRELWASLASLATLGYDQWYREQELLFACPVCGLINSAYDLTCRGCGNDPSSAYTRQHAGAIRAWLAGEEAPS